jgi:hypothetical protein
VSQARRLLLVRTAAWPPQARRLLLVRTAAWPPQADRLLLVRTAALLSQARRLLRGCLTTSSNSRRPFLASCLARSSGSEIISASRGWCDARDHQAFLLGRVCSLESFGLLINGFARNAWIFYVRIAKRKLRRCCSHCSGVTFAAFAAANNLFSSSVICHPIV